MSAEENYIKNIETAIRAIRMGTKKPEETSVGFNLNKLKAVNIGMYEDLMAKYKVVYNEYKSKN